MPNRKKSSEEAEDGSPVKKCPRVDGICDSILDAIGNTPLVRLNRIGNDLPAEILVKCEFLNAGGSVKDRIARQMILDAEKAGRIHPGDTLIEPTSGNTGIGLALGAAVRGYKAIITMPEKMSKEKVDVLKALGAEIIRTPTEAAFDAPDSHISVARRLKEELANAHVLDQYANPSNPNAHYFGTGEEIIRQTGGKVDMLVCGAGTGGTITGIAKRLKEHNPDIQIIGVDPEGSILALPDTLNDKNRLESYQVEGIGYDFIPEVLDRTLIDKWYKSNDKDSLLMMRKLIRDEGLLCGGSSGSAVCVALQAAASLKAGQRCVVILPDSVRNYMTKALSDDWMSDLGYVDGDVIKAKNFSSWWAERKVYELHINTPLTITSDVSCKDAISLLKNEGFDMVPVLDAEGIVAGVVTEGNMTNRILLGRCSPDTSVKDAGVIYKTFHKFSMNDTLATLAHALVSRFWPTSKLPRSDLMKLFTLSFRITTHLL
jgi:cystathionine beta-synthase